MKMDYSPDRQKKLKVWKRNRDHCDGTDAVKANATAYVIKKAKLPKEDYDGIMAGTEYFPMAARTLQSFGGLVFRQEPVFDGRELFPPAISIEGQSAEETARMLFREYMITNDGGMLTDTPDTPAGATLGTVEKLGLFAYQIFYPAEAIRELRYRAISGIKRLVYVRLVEDKDNGRELELVDGVYRATIWERNADGEWTSRTVTPTIDKTPLTDIPFVFYGDGDTGAAMDDLCATNVTHFNKSFLLSQAAGWVSAPVMVIAGVDEDVELDFSPGAFWRFENPNVEYGFSEYKGDGVPLIERELDRLEQHGSMLGSRMLIQEKAVSEAEGTVARRQAGESSILASQARHVSNRFTQSLKTQAKMMGKDPSGVAYTLSTNFVPAAVDPAVLGQLLSLRQANLIPDEAFFETIKKMEVINESWDYEAFMAALDIQKGTTGGAIV